MTIFYEDFFHNNFFEANYFAGTVFDEFFDENILDKICYGKELAGRPELAQSQNIRWKNQKLRNIRWKK